MKSRSMSMAALTLAGFVSLSSTAVQAQSASGSPAKSAAAASSAAQPPTQIQMQATPAIWKIAGAHETVYLFGTVHAMKPEVVWETAKVKDAFDKSDTMYLEIANVGDMAAAQPMVMELGIDQAHPLSTKISKEDMALLDAAIKGMGQPAGEAAFEPMRPWLAYVSLGALPLVKGGYDQQSGIEMKLSAQAKGTTKQVVGFETISQQLHYFADFPEAEQVVMLHQGLADLATSSAKLDEVVSDWTRGDVEAIGKLENGEFRDKYPAVYKKLVVERNERWADELAALLKSDKAGTAFVAVGAAHLAGPDSVQAALEKRGYKAVRQ